MFVLASCYFAARPGGASQNSQSEANSFRDDFSVSKWGTNSSEYGVIWYQDGEYHMHATRGGYIVMYAPDTKDYATENATIGATVRSVYNNSPRSGYGVVVHGERKEGKLEDYGFLIYSGTNPQYKIIMHKRGTETKLVDWTPSVAIRTGASSNRLEIKIKDRKLDFYINGQFMTSISDNEGWLRGRVGFYTSETADIAFDDLEIVHVAEESGILDAVATKKELYPSDANAKSEIDNALKLAGEQKKRVMLIFGGNWCYDCHVLDRALHEGVAGTIVKDKFLLLHVDIGEGDKNLDLLKEYHIPLEKGVPAVAILDHDGRLLYSSGDGEFEAARRMMKKDLVHFLLQWQGQ
jgi:thioredoxin 1